MKKTSYFHFFTFLIGMFLLPALMGQDSQEIKAPSKVKEKEDFHIYLLIGGSNMLGKATFPKPDKGVDSEVFILTSKNEWTSVEEIQKFPGRNPEAENVGPGIPFGKAMMKVARGHVIIGIVNCASEDSSISSWAKGQELYDKAVQKAKAAQKAGVLKGILWNQGEPDALKKDLKDYADSVSKIIEDLRKDLAPELKIHPLPFVGSKLVSFPFPSDKDKDQFKEFNETLEKVFLEVQRRGLVETKGLKTKGESVIYDNDSLIELGRRYAGAMSYLNGKE
ncbi:MAG TPA: hypothetical protein DCZ94_01950 [Lentisphaeria bacterium]|nr:hypothetical protein [Lentisphaeria bacterium]